MKKLVLVITLAAFALSGSAFAQDPAYFDNLGMYVDYEATTGCAIMPVGGAVGYLAITKMTSPDVKAWEAKITPENVFITSVVLEGQALNVASRADEYIVGLTTPLPAVGGTVVLAAFALFIPETSFGSGVPVSGAIYADEVYFSLLENGQPAYIDSADNNKTLYQANALNDSYIGGADVPVFIINGDCSVVANEDVSFGSVKSLFR